MLSLSCASKEPNNHGVCADFTFLGAFIADTINIVRSLPFLQAVSRGVWVQCSDQSVCSENSRIKRCLSCAYKHRDVLQLLLSVVCLCIPIAGDAL